MDHGITGALLGAFLWMLGIQGSGAEWYKVPSGGQVTFTLTEFWAVFKGTPPNTFVLGEATITLEYPDGSTEQIAFVGSGAEVSGGLGSPSGGIGYAFDTSGELSGTSVWTQTASLTAGREFQIVSATPAQSYGQGVEFQGGTGAFIKGFVSKFSTDAPPATQASGPSTTSNVPPPPPSAPVGAPANIHAVIVSGLSDPAKVIVSSNVTLTGGIVALGKNGSPSSTSSAWSPGLKIIPDYDLLTGEKIPPVTPNIIDVRIVRQEVTSDFPSPSLKPDN
jgi:hypothetical protein